jgi:molybdopterin-guanine dinucleotide biosynthesis protein B
MKIVAFVGQSESGKTRLIARLVLELKKRGLIVAIVKHCSSGFDLGGEDKDSSKFLSAGADGIALAAPEQTVVLRRRDRERDLGALAREEFSAADIVLVEGGKSDARLRKIEVLRQSLGGGLRTPLPELAAVVSDHPVACGRPLFHPDNVTEIADWLVANLISDKGP